jgi:RNA polymerase sigma-70 factor (ECF subfamily)
MAAEVDSSVDPAAMTAARTSRDTNLNLGAFYDEHVDYVWRSLYRLGVPPGNLEDAVQDVFVVVLRRLPDFEGRSSIHTWLFGVAIRVAKNHRRAHRRRGPQDPLDEHLPDANPDPQVRTESLEALRLLSRLLDELDDDKRAVFVMAEIEQMTAPEMAEALGANLNTVYSRVRAAREEIERGLARHRRRER